MHCRSQSLTSWPSPVYPVPKPKIKRQDISQHLQNQIHNAKTLSTSVNHSPGTRRPDRPKTQCLAAFQHNQSHDQGLDGGDRGGGPIHFAQIGEFESQSHCVHARTCTERCGGFRRFGTLRCMRPWWELWLHDAVRWMILEKAGVLTFGELSWQVGKRRRACQLERLMSVSSSDDLDESEPQRGLQRCMSMRRDEV